MQNEIDNKLLLAGTAKPPRTAIAWAAIQNQVNALQKEVKDNDEGYMHLWDFEQNERQRRCMRIERLQEQVDSLIRLTYDMNGIKAVFREILRMNSIVVDRQDSLIKALRERDGQKIYTVLPKPASNIIWLTPSNGGTGSPLFINDSAYYDSGGHIMTDIDHYHTNTADPAAAKVVHFNNGCDLPTVKHGKRWARKHKVKEKK